MMTAKMIGTGWGGRFGAVAAGVLAVLLVATASVGADTEATADLPRDAATTQGAEADSAATQPSIAPLSRPVVQRVRGIDFDGRFKRDNRSTHLLRIRINSQVLPVDGAILASLLSSPEVGGAAAEDLFGLTGGDYERVVRIQAATRQVEGQLLAKLTITIKASSAIPIVVFDRYAQALSIYLEHALHRWAAREGQYLDERSATLGRRRAEAETELDTLRNTRLTLAERAGLVDTTLNQHRENLASIVQEMQRLDMELSAREVELSLARQQAAEGEPDASPDPAEDEIAKALSQLVRDRQVAVDAIEADADADPQAVSRAKAELAEARIRHAQRVEQVRMQSPAYRVRKLSEQIAQAQARLEAGRQQANQLREIIMATHRDAEELDHLKTQERLAVQRLEQLDQRLERVRDQVDALGQISVGVVGVTELRSVRDEKGDRK